MPREVSQATVALEEAVARFMEDFEGEFRKQRTKTNHSSERRMRKLLRSFQERVYVPYRDATLPSRDSEPF
jgi:hypothetical protein